MRYRLAGILAAVCMLGMPSQLKADPISMSVQDFIISLGGETGALHVFSDGNDSVANGFNALETQLLTLLGNDSSIASLVLQITGGNSGTLFRTPEAIISELRLALTRRDVPEPSMMLLLGTGLAAFGYSRRRQRSSE